MLWNAAIFFVRTYREPPLASHKFLYFRKTVTLKEPITAILHLNFQEPLMDKM